MAQNFVACEAFYARHSSGPIYSGEWSANYSLSGIDTTDLSQISDDLLPFDMAPDQRPGTNYVTIVHGYLSTTGPAARVALWTVAGYSYWNVNGSWVDNGGIAAIRKSSAVGIGRQTPQYYPSFAGAVGTAIAALAGTGTLNLEVSYRPNRAFAGFWQDFATFGEFATVPPNIPNNPQTSNMETFIDGLISTKLTLTGNRYLCGVNRYVEGASWSAIDATGFITIESSDIGSSDNQIPTDVQNNTADRFRAHPNTFFRHSGDKNRGMGVRMVDDNSISTQGLNQPVGIYVNNSPIVDSNWLVIVDGQPSIIKLFAETSHNTPLQLWNNVLSPMCQGSDSIRKSARINGQLKMNRLSYLTYARMLDRVGTPLEQDNAAPIG